MKIMKKQISAVTTVLYIRITKLLTVKYVCRCIYCISHFLKSKTTN